MPTMVKVEYYSRDGWVPGHHEIALLDPARYVERLEERGKFARAFELAEDLSPTGKVWSPKKLPDRKLLVEPTDGTRIPVAVQLCPMCEEAHRGPYDGSCLI